MDGKNYCPYCMSPVEPGEPCPSCGLTAGAYAPSPHHLPPGTVLRERYLIGRVLGEGGFGITYIGCDLRLELKVAIKEYFPTDRANRVSAASLTVSSYSGAAGERYEAGKTRFLQEARAMARMDKQPVIVSVRDFFELNNTAYIVMEYVEGTTFKDLVAQRGGRIPAGELLHVIEPLFSALGAMHRQGLIHRDISPENLMLENGDVRLLDFGCARESAGGEATMTIALKHGYAPVEQYQNKGQGPWTDVYALSATIYYCLTGRKPPQSMDRLVEDELVRPRKLGVDLTQRQEKALIYGMGVRPRRRFQSVEELHAALYEGVLPEGWDVPSEQPAGADETAEPSGTSLPEDAAAQEAAEPAQPVQTQTQTQTQTQPKPAPAWLEALKARWPVAAGAGAAVLLLITLLVWRPWAGPAGAEEPTPSQAVAGTPGTEDTAAPTQPGTACAEAYSEVSLLSLLENDGVDSVTVGAGTWIDTAKPVTLTKTLRIEANGGVNFNGGLTVAQEGRVEAAGSLDVFTLLRTVDGGAVCVEDGGYLNSSMVWLAREGDLSCAENGVVNAWGGADPTKGEIDGYSRSHYYVFDEEDLFAGAVHVTTEEEFARYCQGGAPIVLDRDLTLTRDYWPTVSIRVPEGITLNAPCPDPRRDEDNCTLEMGSGTVLVNHGTVTGRVAFHGNEVDENGQWLRQNPCMLANFGTVDANLWGEMGAVVNLGTMTVRETLRDTALYNLGSLSFDGQMEARGNWWYLTGTVTIPENGELVLYGGTGIANYAQFVVENGGAVLNYGHLDLNGSGLTVKNGGALHNKGGLTLQGGMLWPENGAELENAGVVFNSSGPGLDAGVFKGPGRLICVDYEGEGTRHVVSESELRAALADGSCDLVVWNGYEPERKINLNGGPLTATKGIILRGGMDTPVDFNTGGLTLSGENAFFISDNADFHGSALTVEGGTALLDGNTYGLGGVAVDGGMLHCRGGVWMQDGIAISVSGGGVVINNSGVELRGASLDVGSNSAFCNYSSLLLDDCTVKNEGRIESNFGDLHQWGGSLVNGGELYLIGWENMANLGGEARNRGLLHIGGQHTVSGTLVNEADGSIELNWEDSPLRVSGRLSNGGLIRGAKGTYIETVDGGSFSGNPVSYGE